MTDDVNSFNDLSNGTDIDQQSQRELVVQWNYDTRDITDIHLYVKVDGGNMDYLGRTGSGAPSYFRWYPNAPKLNTAFSDGPQDGHSYQFTVIFIGETGPVRVIRRLTHAGPVQFMVEQESPLVFQKWSFDGNAWKTTLIAQPEQTGLRVCLTYRAGESSYTNYIILVDNLEISIEIQHEPASDVVVEAKLQQLTTAGDWIDVANSEVATSPGG